MTIVSHRAPIVCAAAIVFALAASTSTAKPRSKAVKITNIGLHIGGGPNDAKTKAPFQKAIEASFDGFRECYAKAETKNGTFGVDILVPAEGGKAEVSKPRTGMKGESFRACVIGVFEHVVFEKPRRGATRFSYSLKFEAIS